MPLAAIYRGEKGRGYIMPEVKIVYLEGNDIRAIRGVITGDDSTFLTIQRHEGNIKINKNAIVKIEEGSYD